MDLLTAFGLASVGAMLLFYALEDRGAVYILYFAIACGLASIYGFMQGAWPFGCVEAVWSGIALKRWRLRSAAQRSGRGPAVSSQGPGVEPRE